MFTLLALLLVCSSVLGEEEEEKKCSDSNEASNNPYSKIVCEALDPVGTTCKNKFQYNNSSVYRKDEDCLFFSDDEIKQFIGHFKINFDEIKEELKDQKDKIEDFLDKYEDFLDMNEKKNGETKYKNILKSYRRLIDNTYKAIYNSNASSYHTANTFNLGAASLAMNGIKYFNDSTVPLVGKSIVKEIKKQCNNDADLMEKFDDAYANDFCNIVKDNDINERESCDNLKDKFVDIHKKKEDICQNLAYKAEFHDKWYLSDKFNQRFAPQILLYERLVNYILCLLKEYQVKAEEEEEKEESKCNEIYFGNKTMDEFLKDFNFETYWKDLINDNTFIKTSDKGFDIWAATKYSPDYDELVNDVYPSEKPETDSMAWWAILLIVLSSVLILAGIVICVMYFLKKAGTSLSIPKKSKKIQKTKTKINGNNLNNSLMDEGESSELM